MKRPVTIINRAAIAIGIKLHDTASILTNSNTNKISIRLSLSSAKAVSIAILDLTGIRVTTEVRLALELAGGTPTVTLDSKLTTVTRVVARRVIIREALIVDSFARVVDDSEARVMAVLISARGSGDG
jgi:hypothetical protein